MVSHNSLAPPARAGGELKGHALRQQLTLIEELVGAERTEEFRKRLPAEVRQRHPANLLVGGWYPLEWGEQVYRAACELPGAASDIPERVGRESLLRDMNGIYRFILSLVSPELALNHGARVLATYMRGPSVNACCDAPRCYTVNFTETHALGPLMWRDMCASVLLLAETAGARGARVTLKLGGRLGEHQTALEVRWRT